tara:strand:- start:1343 stop:1777 length:435 start_codon:yes stop_codon:yes gene_type:complete
MTLKLAKKQDVEALKEFAITMSWVFPLIFMLLLPWLFDRSASLSLSFCWPLVLSGLLLSLYLVYPPGLYYPYRLWMTIASVLSWINTRLILAVAFYGLILPLGVVLRMLGKLQYQAKTKKRAQQLSLWRKSEEKSAKQQLEKPF